MSCLSYSLHSRASYSLVAVHHYNGVGHLQQFIAERPRGDISPAEKRGTLPPNVFVPPSFPSPQSSRQSVTPRRNEMTTVPSPLSEFPRLFFPRKARDCHVTVYFLFFSFVLPSSFGPICWGGERDMAICTQRRHVLICCVAFQGGYGCAIFFWRVVFVLAFPTAVAAGCCCCCCSRLSFPFHFSSFLCFFSPASLPFFLSFPPPLFSSHTKSHHSQQTINKSKMATAVAVPKMSYKGMSQQ